MTSLPRTPETLELLKRYRDLQLAKRAAEENRFARYVADPDGFVERQLHESLWSKQREIIRSVRDNRKTAVQSCHGIGKSFIASRTAGWWIAAHPPGEAFVVTTAPTFRQVKNVVWREINKMHRKAKLPGRCNQVEWLIDDEIVGFGVSPADGDPDAMQGIHAPFVLVILDEACGVSGKLWPAADSLTSNEDSRELAIGNPTDPTTEFFRVCAPGSGWSRVQISAFDSPNFTGEDVPEPVKKLLVSKVWVEEKRRQWGADSPLWKARVLGEFPEVNNDGLLPMKALQEAIDRDLPAEGRKELGVDVARFGDDWTVGYGRVGPVARVRFRYQGKDTMVTCGHVARAVKDEGFECVKVDDTGVGGGVTDRLREMQREGTFPKSCEIVPINVGSGVMGVADEEKYYNLRAQVNWGLRQRFVDGAIDIDGAESQLLGQAAQIRYAPNSRGQIVIEQKADMKKRLKEAGLDNVSPDDWDALVLCFADPSYVGRGIMEFYKRSSQAPKAEAAKAPEPVALVAPPNFFSTFVGPTGKNYTMDGKRRIHVHPDDLAAAKRLGFKEES